MTTLVTPAPQVPRDRWSRPLVVPPGGGKPTAYTRATTFVSVIEDTFNLSRWQQRMVALGLSQRPDLMLGVTATDPGDKKALDKFCEGALEAAKAHAGATVGTALHSLAERIDRKQDVGVIPDAYQADLAAYTEATKELKSVQIEQFCVLDNLKIGGTPDRVVSYKGKRFIADIKTGNIEYGILKIAMQLAVYARSNVYDVETGDRGEHGADVHRGIIIHLPAGTGTCELVWVDLIKGWDAVRVARDVRKQRAIKFADLTEPFNQPDLMQTVAESIVTNLAGKIRACTTTDAVTALWAQHAKAWTDELTEIAREHIAGLAS